MARKNGYQRAYLSKAQKWNAIPLENSGNAHNLMFGSKTLFGVKVFNKKNSKRDSLSRFQSHTIQSFWGFKFLDCQKEILISFLIFKESKSKLKKILIKCSRLGIPNIFFNKS